VFVTDDQPNMRLLFCADSLNKRQIDSMYGPEAAAAGTQGLAFDLLDFEALVDDGNAEHAVRRVAMQPRPLIGVYRGWMLRAEQYALLFSALGDRGLNLINDPDAYRRCHYLPEWYSLLEDVTPRSVWIATGPEVSIELVMDVLTVFGSAPVVLKDFVKSRKHEWEAACFIPSAADRSAVERVVHRFLELQGTDLAGGLVFREFVELEQLGRHAKSSMPLTREFRLFFANHRLIASLPYWDEVDYGATNIPLEQFEGLASRVASRFFTMDVARRVNGSWLIVELGDGQVAGLPDTASIPAFYASLVSAIALGW
jgi:hypothetical protein